MEMLKRAFLKHENNSMLLLARSKQTMHAFISAVEEQVKAMFDKEIETIELKVIRVNSILSNSETKILQRLSEALKITRVSQSEPKSSFHSVEMVDSIKEYFERKHNQAVLFVLEDIDYYVETTKQLLLYKILDMFTYLSQDWNVRFVFLATSVKVDIVDSFEKRIKSRFSHRLVLFYDQQLSKFNEQLQSIFNEQLAQATSDYQRK
jgi:origin recognition complex subunit 4